jgi:apolipoprotein N-acyltransferase
METSPNVLLLPEDTRLLTSYNPAAALVVARFSYQLNQTMFIDSGVVEEEGLRHLRALILDGATGFAAAYDKQYLVPQGEFLPYLPAAIFRLLGGGDGLIAGSELWSSTPGPHTNLSDMPTHVPGIMFCAESIVPLAAWRLAHSGAQYIVHPFSHGWFQDTRILSQQLDAMLRVQARFSGVPIVSAGNQGVGATYFPDGTVEIGTVSSVGVGWQVRVLTL